MKIYLARHGQSQWQVDRTVGEWKSPLTACGQRQAQHLGQWLAEHESVDHRARIEINCLHASPLLRAQQTAAFIATALQLPITTDDHLRESDFLVSEQLPSAQLPGSTVPPYTLSAAYTGFKQQADQALRGLIATADANEGTALAITHGGLISTLLRAAVGSDTISFWIYNASLNLIEWKRGRWHLVFLNLWDHLPPELRTF